MNILLIKTNENSQNVLRIDSMLYVFQFLKNKITKIKLSSPSKRLKKYKRRLRKLKKKYKK